jgi:hypothetical protein
VAMPGLLSIPLRTSSVDFTDSGSDRINFSVTAGGHILFPVSTSLFDESYHGTDFCEKDHTQPLAHDFLLLSDNMCISSARDICENLSLLIC